jgi:hypothetical protein
VPKFRAAITAVAIFLILFSHGFPAKLKQKFAIRKQEETKKLSNIKMCWDN